MDITRIELPANATDVEKYNYLRAKMGRPAATATSADIAATTAVMRNSADWSIQRYIDSKMDDDYNIPIVPIALVFIIAESKGAVITLHSADRVGERTGIQAAYKFHQADMTKVDGGLICKLIRQWNEELDLGWNLKGEANRLVTFSPISIPFTLKELELQPSTITRIELPSNATHEKKYAALQAIMGELGSGIKGKMWSIRRFSDIKVDKGNHITTITPIAFWLSILEFEGVVITLYADEKANLGSGIQAAYIIRQAGMVNFNICKLIRQWNEELGLRWNLTGEAHRLVAVREPLASLEELLELEDGFLPRLL